MIDTYIMYSCVRQLWRSCGLSLIAASGLIAPAAALGATVPIVNGSFEDVGRPLAAGEVTNGVGGAGVSVATRFIVPGNGTTPSWDTAVVVPGWRCFVQPAPSTATIRAGVLNPHSINGVPFVQGQDGQNVAAIQNAGMGQALAITFAPSTRYRIDFRAGIGLTDSDYFATVALVALDTAETMPLLGREGVFRVAITNGLRPPRSTFGTMLSYSLEYTTPEVLPPMMAGKTVGIYLGGSDGIPRVVYDDIRMDATVVPSPGAVVWCVAGGVGLVARRGRTGHRASTK
jgi:hypothetical protein